MSPQIKIKGLNLGEWPQEEEIPTSKTAYIDMKCFPSFGARNSLKHFRYTLYMKPPSVNEPPFSCLSLGFRVNTHY